MRLLRKAHGSEKIIVSRNRTYSGLHKNWLFAYFEKITVAVGWVYIKVWPIPHLKALTPTFWPT